SPGSKPESPRRFQQASVHTSVHASVHASVRKACAFSLRLSRRFRFVAHFRERLSVLASPAAFLPPLGRRGRGVGLRCCTMLFKARHFLIGAPLFRDGERKPP